MLPIAEGERWAYQKAGLPLQEVTVLKAPSQSGNSRVRVQFEEGEAEGQTEWVFRRMLKVPWGQREAFLRREDWWEAARLASRSIPQNEMSAAEVIISETVDPAIASAEKYGILAARNLPSVERLAGRPIKDGADTFDEDGITFLVWPAMREVAQAMAKSDPRLILQYVENDLAELATMEQRARQLDSLKASPSPQAREQSRLFVESWRGYLNVIREWCGEESLANWDEILRLRRETAFLSRTLAEALDLMDDGGLAREAKRIRRELGYPGE